MTALRTEPTPAAETPPNQRRSRRRLAVILLVAALALGAAWWFLLRPAEADQVPEPGEVVQLEAIQVNLADGHYLRIGIALQATADVDHALDGSKALDATIELFTGEDKENLARPAYRKKLKSRLTEQLEERYHGEVLTVYFTDFVTQ